jgi:hypothetical protein
VHESYSEFWKSLYKKEFLDDQWSITKGGLEKLNNVQSIWDKNTPLKNLLSRRYALVELDVLNAMNLGLSLLELIDIYNIQFSISKKFEDDTWYDRKGNIVFTPSSKTLSGVGVDRPVWETIRHLKAGETYEHTITKSELYQGKKISYHAPFDKCDRVEDYKVAWAHFDKIFKDKTD